MASPQKSSSESGRLVRIGVEGFKSIDELQTLELAPITLLAGANSAGKSTMLQPLLLLKQTLEAPLDPGTLLLSDQHVKFTRAEQMLFRGVREGGRSDFAIELENDEGIWVRLVYASTPGEGVNVREMRYRFGRTASVLAVRPGMALEEIKAQLPSSFVGESLLSSRVDRDDWSGWGVVRERCFLGFSLNGQVFPFYSPFSPFLKHISGVLHLPGLRGNPERAYLPTAVEAAYPGTFERYVASVISHWQRMGDPRIGALSEDLKTLGLTWRIEAQKIDDTRVELRVGRMPALVPGGDGDLVNIADVGFGVSQTLPVLVALRTAGPGRIVYLEQPEIHLHPNAQAALARIIADAAKRGVIVVLETHSAILLRSLQTLIARGELQPEQVGFNWFSRDEKTGATRIRKAVPDADGTYGDWPEDFDDVALRVEKEYLDAIEARHHS